jgi:hypothetical protein
MSTGAETDCRPFSYERRQGDPGRDGHGGSANIAVIGSCQMFAVKMEEVGEPVWVKMKRWHCPAELNRIIPCSRQGGREQADAR